jgi:DNA invertase Pin-like site-specific DNA recombinase
MKIGTVSQCSGGFRRYEAKITRKSLNTRLYQQIGKLTMEVDYLKKLAELERDFISERMKDGLLALVAKGIQLDKPKGTIQKLMYDKDKDKILQLYT